MFVCAIISILNIMCIIEDVSSSSLQSFLVAPHDRDLSCPDIFYVKKHGVVPSIEMVGAL